jgi:hypothetical protein
MKIALQKAKLANAGLGSHKKLLSKLAHAKLVRNLKNNARLGLKQKADLLKAKNSALSTKIKAAKLKALMVKRKAEAAARAAKKAA